MKVSPATAADHRCLVCLDAIKHRVGLCRDCGRSYEDTDSGDMRDVIAWATSHARGADIARRAAERRMDSWCCHAPVIEVQAKLVLEETAPHFRREWVPAIVLLCRACRKQMIGDEYAPAPTKKQRGAKPR